MLSETTQPDRATGRFYCSECFLPTLEVQLAATNAKVDWEQAGGQDQFSPNLLTFDPDPLQEAIYLIEYNPEELEWDE